MTPEGEGLERLLVEGGGAGVKTSVFVEDGHSKLSPRCGFGW